MSAPAWLPDWRDENNYPNVESTLHSQWAWEFLRRNPEYQVDCARVEQGAISVDEFKEHWRIVAPLNPTSAYDPHFRISYLGRFGVGIGEMIESLDLKNVDGMVYAFIDLNRPVKPQLEAFERYALNEQKSRGFNIKERKIRTSELSDYLRILDGTQCGASAAAIADVLYPLDGDRASARRKVSANLKAARALIHDYDQLAHDYLDIFPMSKEDMEYFDAQK